MPKRLLYLILGATAVRMLVSLMLEFGNDEAYYFLYALDLHPNYFDHPPGVAVLIRLFTLNLLLTDEFFVRLGAIACSAAGTYLIYRLGTVLKNEQTGWFASILYTMSIYTSLIAGTFIIPDSPQVVAWLAAVLIMHAIVSVPSNQQVELRSWLLFGLISGAAILCKVHGVFLWVSLGGYLLLYARHRLAQPGVYLGALTTLVVISPILIWNIQHDFITYRFHSGRVEVQDSWLHLDFFIQAVMGQLIYCNPVNAVLILLSLWKLKTTTFMEKESVRFVLLNALPIIAVVTFFSLFSAMLPHWSGPGFMVLSLLAAAYLDEKAFMSNATRVPSVLRIGSGSLGALVIVAILFINLYPGTIGSKNKERFGDDDFTLDLYGWSDFAKTFGLWLKEEQRLGRVPNDMPLVSSKWFPAAHVEYYVARPLDIPMIGVGYFGDLHQYVWLNETRPPLEVGGSALCIIPSNYNLMIEDRFSRDFESSRLLHVFYSYRNGHMARYFSVYQLDGYKGKDEAHLGVFGALN